MRRKEIRPRLQLNKKLLESVILDSTSFSNMARRLGYPEYSIKGYANKLAKKVKLFDLNHSHFSNAIVGAALGKTDEEIFRFGVTFSNSVQRKRLIELRGNICEKCGISKWLDEPLVMDIHHLNGNRKDNRKENLLIVCPNCHRTSHRRVKRGKLYAEQSQIG